METVAPRIPTSTSQNTSTQGAQLGRLRPRSLYQPSSIRRDAHEEDRKVPTHSAGLNRSQSLRRPGVSTQPSQPTSNRGHMRAQSSTVSGVRNKNADIGPGIEKPKSFLVAPSHTTKTGSGVPTDAPTGAIRSSARLEALKRSGSTKIKQETTHTRTNSGSSISHDESLHSQLGHREAPKKAATRPAFSTLQQHFTPKKVGKAPTSTFLHPTSDASSHSLPPEIISLQAELLQLHLLHEASTRTSRQWEFHAQNSLRAKFDEVASLYQAMRQSEQHGREQKNLLALREWNGGNSSSGLVEYIQRLSGPLHGVPSLLGPGGRFCRLVDDFDRWISGVEKTWSVREGQQANGMSSESLEGLGDTWKEENAALMRKLTAFSRDLDALPAPPQDSSIACIVSACSELLRGLLGELQIMQVIETGVVSKEKQWIEGQLHAIGRDGGAPLDSRQGKEAWRMV